MCGLTQHCCLEKIYYVSFSNPLTVCLAYRGSKGRQVWVQILLLITEPLFSFCIFTSPSHRDCAYFTFHLRNDLSNETGEGGAALVAQNYKQNYINTFCHYCCMVYSFCTFVFVCLLAFTSIFQIIFWAFSLVTTKSNSASQFGTSSSRELEHWQLLQRLQYITVTQSPVAQMNAWLIWTVGELH